ncbi:hypothetical protein EDB81DRAFT_204517 [Dactylonectria macrodidyma]|uniref:Uncharacterized protein n=1 Tax=Dactylonectria macrodidyma TaxID=307937 RepID=A0A9P9IMP8_9HYPO|nr:hypothetical protein EDB81DRAFT_204517 [Dactylonectria macrodidyma]
MTATLSEPPPPPSWRPPLGAGSLGFQGILLLIMSFPGGSSRCPVDSTGGLNWAATFPTGFAQTWRTDHTFSRLVR